MSNDAKIRKAALQLNPIDDTLFCVLAEHKEVCHEIIEAIIDGDGVEIESHTPQRELRNLQGRSVRLDVECILSNGMHIDLEVQRSDNDDHQRRARYNGSCLTTNISNPGIYFKDVPDVIVIFITENDFLGEGSLIYHIDRTLRGKVHTADNGFEEIYVNAAYDDGSRLASMMKIFVKDGYYDEKEFPHLSKWKRHFKTEEEGVERMCTILEELHIGTAYHYTHLFPKCA